MTSLRKESGAEERPDAGVPQPPPFKRKITIAPLQLIGIPILALLPLLALLGVFGESLATVQASNEALALHVEYIARYRYKMDEEMTIDVTKLSSQSPATVTVTIERGYLDNFSDLSITPDVETVTEESYVVRLPEMESGETRVISVRLRGDQRWRHSGVVAASLDDSQPISITVSTIVFP